MRLIGFPLFFLDWFLYNGLIVPSIEKEHSHGHQKENSTSTPERNRLPAEERAKKRLWRIANVGLTAERLINIEQAWTNKEDEKILAVINDWGWDRDPVLDTLFLDLAHENEDRGWAIYRAWLRGKFLRDPNWLLKKVNHTQERIKAHELLSDELKSDRIVALQRTQWQIAIEEGQALLGGDS